MELLDWKGAVIIPHITPESAGYRDNNVNKLQHKGIIENMYGKRNNTKQKTRRSKSKKINLGA